MMNSQRSDAKKVNLIEVGNKQELIKLLSTMKLLITGSSNTCKYRN